MKIWEKIKSLFQKAVVEEYPSNYPSNSEAIDAILNRIAEKAESSN